MQKDKGDEMVHAKNMRLQEDLEKTKRFIVDHIRMCRLTQIWRLQRYKRKNNNVGGDMARFYPWK